jgi:hypothetical protein
MADERDPYNRYTIFVHDASDFHYSGVDTEQKNSTSVQYNSGGIHLRCTDVGTKPVGWHLFHLWWLLKGYVKKNG